MLPPSGRLWNNTVHVLKYMGVNMLVSVFIQWCKDGGGEGEHVKMRPGHTNK